MMNDRENDNRIKDEGRQVQQELEDQLRAFGDTMTDAFRNGFEGRGHGDRGPGLRYWQGRCPCGQLWHRSGGSKGLPAGPGWLRHHHRRCRRDARLVPADLCKAGADPGGKHPHQRKKRYSNGCTLLAVGITFAVIFGLGGIGCIAASDALLPGLITETMIGDTVATAPEGMTYTFTTGASMATTVLESRAMC